MHTIFCALLLAAALLPAAIGVASTSVTLDDSAGPASTFHGLGGLSGGGATSVLLRAYPEPQRTVSLARSRA
jgi:galactosylceramidase